MDGGPWRSPVGPRCSSVVATGGDITTFVGDGTIGAAGTTYVVHTFATVGASLFTLNAPYALDHLIVGGGGGGGGGGCTGRDMCAGGGGGGAVVTGTRTLEAATAGETLAVVVGDGGAGGGDIALVESPGVAGYAAAGDASSFDGVTALGGGAGGSAPFTGNADVGDPYALPTPSTVFTEERSTGGGGVGQTKSQLGAIGNATAGTDTSGRGGIGIASSITGTRTEYGSGGGGGKRSSGFGVPGGAISGLVTAGGAGGRDAAAAPGVSGRGGGGGGAGRNADPPVGDAVGGPGGAGIVFVRYALPA